MRKAAEEAEKSQEKAVAEAKQYLIELLLTKNEENTRKTIQEMINKMEVGL